MLGIDELLMHRSGVLQACKRVLDTELEATASSSVSDTELLPQIRALASASSYLFWQGKQRQERSSMPKEGSGIIGVSNDVDRFMIP